MTRLVEVPEIITVGRISIDLYSEQLGAGWTQSRSFEKAVGGSPTNVAVAAARLGHRAAVYTKVGGDPFGTVARHELEAYGVDTRWVGVNEGALTPLAFAVLDPPEDPQLLFRREPPVPDLDLHAGEIPEQVVAAVPVLWISGGALSSDPSRRTVQGMLAARQGARHTILDLDYRPSFWSSAADASRTIGEAVRRATVAVGNREECQIAVGTGDPSRAASRLLERGVELAIVKLGGDGVLLADRSGEQLLAPAPSDVVCGLGAGDAFGGALCHGLLAGWPPAQTVAFAAAAGGIVASRLLCSAAMPSVSEVNELLDGARA